MWVMLLALTIVCLIDYDSSNGKSDLKEKVKTLSNSAPVPTAKVEQEPVEEFIPPELDVPSSAYNPDEDHVTPEEALAVIQDIYRRSMNEKSRL